MMAAAFSHSCTNFGPHTMRMPHKVATLRDAYKSAPRGLSVWQKFQRQNWDTTERCFTLSWIWGNFVRCLPPFCNNWDAPSRRVLQSIGTSEGFDYSQSDLCVYILLFTESNKEYGSFKWSPNRIFLMDIIVLGYIEFTNSVYHWLILSILNVSHTFNSFKDYFPWFFLYDKFTSNLILINSFNNFF